MKQHNAQLIDNLFPKVRQRVLGLLFGYPERDFYTNEIIRLIHMGHGVVQCELEKLSAAGILKFVVVGNQKASPKSLDKYIIVTSAFARHADFHSFFLQLFNP